MESTGVEAQSTMEQVFRQEGPRLWRSLVLSFGDVDVASDAVAEAFAQLLARGPGVHDPTAWVWRAAYKIGAGLMKDRGRDDHLSPEGTVHLPDELVEVLVALGQLRPSEREAVVLADYVGYRHAEIGRMVGVSAGAIAVRVHRGRKALRRLLEVRDE